jgi:hypothetical protein
MRNIITISIKLKSAESEEKKKKKVTEIDTYYVGNYDFLLGDCIYSLKAGLASWRLPFTETNSKRGNRRKIYLRNIIYRIIYCVS